MKRGLNDLTRSPAPVVPIQTEANKQIFIKRNLAKSVNRDIAVVNAIADWLLSFEGGITSKAFKDQLVGLEKDDAKAIEQLKASAGKRRITKSLRQKPPKLTGEIVDELEKHNAIAIEAKAGRNKIEEFLDDCPEIGTYILDINELILEYVDYAHRGKAGDIIHNSTRADILVILGLEKPIALPYHIKDTLYQILSVRSKDEEKYTVSTWNYTHEWYISEVKQLLTHYSV